MQRIESILVGTEGSVHAAVALDWAGRLATALDASVRIVHRVPTEDGDDRDVQHPVFTRAMARWSNELNAPEVEQDQMIVHGDPRTEIIQLADETDADLIVIGARGEGGFSELRLGRVANDLIHHTDCPIAVVPHAGGPIAGGTRGHGDFGGRTVGHVAAQLAAHSRVAVVIVPHTG